MAHNTSCNNDVSLNNNNILNNERFYEDLYSAAVRRGRVV